MSEPAATTRATVRPAGEADAVAVAVAVESLLVELGGRKPSREEIEAEARAAIADPAIGTILVAAAGAAIVGVLTSSWQRALHVPGRYATIEDLWVDPRWRSRGVGAELMDAMVALCTEQGVSRIEVGLPRESFAAIRSTEGFYSANGFEQLGPRMRRLLA